MAKAVRFDRYGGTDVLYVADVDIPSPAAGEVVVEVKAAGINPGEASIRKGLLDAVFPATFPSGEGSDLAGVVHQLGDGVTEFSVGDEVLGWSWQRSSQAEYVVGAGRSAHRQAARTVVARGGLPLRRGRDGLRRGAGHLRPTGRDGGRLGRGRRRGDGGGAAPAR